MIDCMSQSINTSNTRKDNIEGLVSLYCSYLIHDSLHSPIFMSTDGELRPQLAGWWHWQHHFPHQSVSISQTFIYLILHINICGWLTDGAMEATTAYSGSVVSHHASRISLHDSRVRLMAPELVSRVWRWVSKSQGLSSMTPRFQKWTSMLQIKYGHHNYK